MTKDIQIKVLQDNVLELQGQLAAAQKRIKELNEEVSKMKPNEEMYDRIMKKGLGL